MLKKEHSDANIKGVISYNGVFFIQNMKRHLNC